MERLLALVQKLLPVFVAIAVTAAAAAEPRATAVDTEHLFGFLTGTDIGDPGDVELESETNSQFGKRAGSYQALSQAIALEYTPAENLRLELGALLGHHAISGVPDIDDVHRTAFQGLSFQARYRLLSRERAGTGVTLLAEPRWAWIDEASGQAVSQYGAGFGLLIDKELVPDRLVAAFNALYEPETTKLQSTGAWSRDSTLGLGTALMWQLQPGFFIGAETRYLRAYDSLNWTSFAGHALFLGPAIYIRPSERWRMTAAWSGQVAGSAVDDPGALDLKNFARHQVKLRIGYQF